MEPLRPDALAVKKSALAEREKLPEPLTCVFCPMVILPFTENDLPEAIARLFIRAKAKPEFTLKLMYVFVIVPFDCTNSPLIPLKFIVRTCSPVLESKVPPD